MCKSLYLEPGHLARCGGLWYEPGILLIVEEQDEIELYVNRNGMPGDRLGTYGYAALDPWQPPGGLRSAVRERAVPVFSSVPWHA